MNLCIFSFVSNPSELFGGRKNFVNFNNKSKETKTEIISSNNKKIEYKHYPFDNNIEEGTGIAIQTVKEVSDIHQYFNDSFSRIFVTTKEANKLNLSSSDKKLNFNCDNLENVLRRVLENPLNALEIKEWLNLLRPGFSDIKIEKDISEKSFIQFYEEGYEKPFGKNLISDGTYNILCLLTAIYQTDEPQFLCIEEPENGLNPYVIKELVTFFREQCKEKGHYIWINTHSQTLVNQLQPEEIIIINKENGVTKPRQIKDKNMHGLPMDEAWLTNVLGGGVPW
jgi:predicted ATPase